MEYWKGTLFSGRRLQSSPSLSLYSENSSFGFCYFRFPSLIIHQPSPLLSRLRHALLHHLPFARLRPHALRGFLREPFRSLRVPVGCGRVWVRWGVEVAGLFRQFERGKKRIVKSRISPSMAFAFQVSLAGTRTPRCFPRRKSTPA